MKIRDAGQRYSGFFEPQHQLLLKAALLDKDSAVPAFEAWNDQADWVGDFDAGTYQMLPQLYANLDRHGYDAPIMARLRGVYRNTWYRNQKLLAVLQNLVEQLELSGIRTMLLGDGALMHGYCISPGVRYLHALDILIPAEHAAAASAIMLAKNWQSADGVPFRQHACFTNSDSHSCTLYWYTPPKTGLSHETSWERARPVQINGIDTLIPDAPEMLLHHVGNGLTENGVPTLPGLAGAAIIAGSQDLDWPAVATLASDNFMGLKLHMALTRLNAELETPIPDAVLSELGKEKVSLVEKLEQRAARRRPDAKDNFFGPLERLSLQFLQYTGRARPAAMLAELPAFLRFHYGTDSLVRILGSVTMNGMRRIGRVIGRLFRRKPGRLTA